MGYRVSRHWLPPSIIKPQVISVQLGALFQILAVSLLKLILAATDFASSFQAFIELTLNSLSVTALFGLFGSSLSGY